ncbi:MAG: Ig-like domain-containing protein [Eubacterium sp.]|nr:Ig-like domain-containing protein [Eubacterium sp.]
MTKKTMKTVALGLTLALGIMTISEATPKKIIAASVEVPSAEEVQTVDDWNLDGGWIEAEDHTVTEDVKNIIQKAVDSLTVHVVGVSRRPIAYLGYQVVAGTNHCILVKSGPVIPNPIYSYELVYIYEALDGKCEITKTQSVDIADYASYADPADLAEITLNKNILTIKKGKKKTLKAKIKYCADKSPVFVWKSTNKKVATVNKNGVVKAKKKGSCTITCMIKGLPGTTRYCYVTVKK